MAVAVAESRVVVLGSTVPRLFTPPLVTGPPGPCGCGCALTAATSYGFREVAFNAATLGRTKWPWQRWLSIHGGELRPDGVPRFRRLIVEVGRQSGKTREVEDLTVFWIFEERHSSVLGTSTLTKYAKKPWAAAFRLALATPDLRARMGESPERKAIRKAAGEEEWWTEDDCHYAVAASNAEGGRSMANKRVIADEFAKQYNYDAYGAAYYSMDAFEDAQYWALTTPDAKGEPYNDLRTAALSFIETGVGDPTLGLFSWSAPDDADPTDLRALAMANPTLGLPGGKSPPRLLNEARGAVAKGGELLRTFKTEIMCVQAGSTNQAISSEAWKRCRDVDGTLDDLRDRVAGCVDVAPDGAHVTFAVAARLDDDRVRVEVVAAWQSTEDARYELGPLLDRVKPYVLAWYPSGPAAALGPLLRPPPEDPKPARPRRPERKVVELKGATVAEVCQSFADLVKADRILQPDDPLLNNHVGAAERYYQGDGWRFVRRGVGHVDAVYAAAGAVHVALTVPVEAPRPRSRVW